MPWAKSPPSLIAAFDAAFPADPRAEKRQMFGYPAGFIGGNMFAGLWQEHVVVRAAEADAAALLKVPGAAPFEPMAGRPMKGYVRVPPAVVADRAQLSAWLRRALDHGATLPAKASKKKPAARKPAARKPVAKKRR